MRTFMTPLQKARYRINLMQLQTRCSENYLRLLRPLRALAHHQTLELDLGPAGRVRLHVIASGRYTSDLYLTRTNPQPFTGTLSMAVRLYHDARLAEVLHMQTGERTQANNSYPNIAMHQPDEKHQWNRFLSEWLRHLDQHGEPDMQHWQFCNLQSVTHDL